MSTAVEPEELSYPDKADANGYAKKYYKRRAFYFGVYNSPESFQLFGEWKRQLLESGNAPEVKAVRKDIAHKSGPNPPKANDHLERRTTYLWPFVSIISALLVSGTILGSAKLLSTTIGPTVDGKTLSDEEMEVVRGIRSHKEIKYRTAQLSAYQPESLAERMRKLKEEGPGNADRHKGKIP